MALQWGLGGAAPASGQAGGRAGGQAGKQAGAGLTWQPASPLVARSVTLSRSPRVALHHTHSGEWSEIGMRCGSGWEGMGVTQNLPKAHSGDDGASQGGGSGSSRGGGASGSTAPTSTRHPRQQQQQRQPQQRKWQCSAHLNTSSTATCGSVGMAAAAACAATCASSFVFCSASRGLQ